MLSLTLFHIVTVIYQLLSLGQKKFKSVSFSILIPLLSIPPSSQNILKATFYVHCFTFSSGFPLELEEHRAPAFYFFDPKSTFFTATIHIPATLTFLSLQRAMPSLSQSPCICCSHSGNAFPLAFHIQELPFPLVNLISNVTSSKRSFPIIK